MQRLETTSELIQKLMDAALILDQYGCHIYKLNDDYFFKSMEDEYFKINVDEILVIIRKFVKFPNKDYIGIQPKPNRRYG